ncbi:MULTISPECIES: N-acetylglucosamine-6-phosphate deacetylase [unclassified Exiguobacterium]|uniref:N-acetylglucosamine-6-phosphate deacetylase n=1 Tax=unclassified Exiguobacterium TaxID=2644629 RepID=UPI000B596893|nr:MULTISPECIES: N-acetylglucosamine-6-phosphate deacetylase [unclassified Exiguobacterium]ASI34464.1 N-acetylglucosamine-6-phosphate deacetylase [Exiguobacterium sp. N4-1P]
MTVIINANIYTGQTVIEKGFIRFEETISELGDMTKYVPVAEEGVLDLEGKQLIPGMIDVHIHGGYDVDTMDADKKGLMRLSQAMLAEGVTSFFATTITQDWSQITRALEAARQVMETETTTIEGIHLEGPFINPDYAGAQPLDYIVEPDVEQFLKWQQAAGGQIKLVTYAPERPGARAFEEAVRLTGAVPSAGHTDATYEQNEQGNVVHGTHLYNQMRALHHREPGTVGYCLLNPAVRAEIIPDGIHSAKEMVDFAYRMKGASRLTVITDAMRAKGLPEGQYELGGQAVDVKDGAARLASGNLAGSVLTMDQALRNIIAFTGCSLEEAVRMTSINQAEEFGLTKKGVLEIGKDADFVVLDESLFVERTIHRGAVHTFKK